MTTELEKYIHDYFAISPGDCQKIAGLFKTETLEKGSYFLQPGNHCDRFSFIRSGVLRVYIELPDREVTQWVSTASSFLTDLHSFIFRQPSRFYIQALTDSRLYTINHEQYLTMGQLIPGWHELEKLLMGKCFVMLENRVFDFIALSAEERYKKLFSQNRDLFAQVPAQYLASMLGMTPETLSRIRKKVVI